MNGWLKGIRGAALTALLWVIVWGLGFGGIMELIDPDGQIEDIWPMVLGIPGLIGGVIFSALLLIFESGRTFSEIPLARIALWGAVTGVVLGLLTIPAEIGDVSPGAAGMTAIAVALSVTAAAISALVFRMAASRDR